jgi:hypothetical protein
MRRAIAVEKVKTLPRRESASKASDLPPISRPITPPRSRATSQDLSAGVSPSKRPQSARSVDSDLYHIKLPSSPPMEIKPAPWAQYRGPTPQAMLPSSRSQSIKSTTTTPSIVSRGGSLLDQLLAERSQVTSPTTSSVLLESDTESTRSTPKAKRTQPLPTVRSRGGRTETGIVTPFDAEIEGSIGGSPPESDEDEPSVALPHSAVKKIQRPTGFIEGDDDRSSVAGSTTTSRAAWSERKEETYDKRMAARRESISKYEASKGSPSTVKATATPSFAQKKGVSGVNANETPLGMRMTDRKTSLPDEIHGFKKYNPTPRLVPGGRRETPEYQV